MLAVAVRTRRLTYLDRAALVDLYRAAATVDSPGVIIEAGTALGGSAAMLAAAMPSNRTLHLYDTFSTIPAPSEKDGADVHARYASIASGQSEGIRGDTYYGYRTDLLDHVRRTVRRYAPDRAVEFHPGFYEDSLRPSESVSLAHVDCDWYSSVRVCLQRIWPALSTGGRIIVDDYDAWSGARRAVDEFVIAEAPSVERHARLHLIKPE